jgi:hypothetical protein
MHPFALSASRDHTRTAQVGEVPRNFRLTQAKNLHQVADTHLAAGNQIEQTQPRSVGKGRE